MKVPSRVLVLAAVVVIAGCADRIPTAPLSPVDGVVTRKIDEPPPLPPGVGTMGVIDQISKNERKLVLLQNGLELTLPPGAKYKEKSEEFAVGSRRNKLEVHIKDDAKIFLNGVEKTVADLEPGMQLIILGRVTGSSLHAEVISDFQGAGEPVDSIVSKLPPDEEGLVSNPRVGGGPMIRTTSLCMGQDLDYNEANVLEFQGCWGGPSASDDLNTPFIPVFCPLIGCFGVDRFSYTMALGGWSFAFPFRFKASASPGLVYHVPGNVSLGMDPLPATTGAFSFAGGLGMDFGLNIDFCSFFGCYDIHTFHLAAFSMIHQATGAGPLEGTMDIAETSCPAIGIVPVENFPDPLKLGLCEDLGLNGKPFNTTVSSSGANPAVWQRLAFTNATQTTLVRPDAMSVAMRYDDFDWRPGMTMGLAFRFIVFGIPVWTTPPIPFGEIGLFDAVTNPFPLSGSVFTVATDPLSPADELRYLFQPTSTSIRLEVAPAPTTLSITSASLLTEGTQLTVKLTESYDGSPISGQSVSVSAVGLNGTASVTLAAMTNGSGIASFLLPVGEFDVSASYGGAATYLASTARQRPVYVYRPTTFVIWGGNERGIVASARYQFWGQGWVSQVVSGKFAGNPSFQGFALPLDASTWASPPASSGHAPDQVPNLIGVIVSTDIRAKGANTTGNIAAHAVLRVDDPEGYTRSAGHRATGVVRVLMP